LVPRASETDAAAAGADCSKDETGDDCNNVPLLPCTVPHAQFQIRQLGMILVEQMLVETAVVVQ